MAAPPATEPSRVVLAGQWFNSFNNLISEGRTLLSAIFMLVAVLGVVRALYSTKGAIVPLVTSGICGAIGLWLITHFDENAKRTDTEFTGAARIVVTAANPSMAPDRVVDGIVYLPGSR
jgi:membrane-bound ClpP family serine protease